MEAPSNASPRVALERTSASSISRASSAGRYCGQILGDHGADVLKVEPPQGDDTRTWGPPFKDGVASYYLGLNRNKRLMRLDLTTEADRAVLLELLADADVLVENFKTGTHGEVGHRLRHACPQRFPRLIHCRVSGFGADGPLGGLPGYDAAVQALTGIMSVNGEAGRRAAARRPAGGRHGHRAERRARRAAGAAGARSAAGAASSSRRRCTTRACRCCIRTAANWFLDGSDAAAAPATRTRTSTRTTAWHTGTEPIFLAVGNDRQFAILCRHLGAPALAGDERFATAGARSVQPRGAEGRAARRCSPSHDGPTLADALVAAGVPCAPVLSVPRRAPASAHRASRHGGGDALAAIAASPRRSSWPHAGQLPLRAAGRRGQLSCLPPVATSKTPVERSPAAFNGGRPLVHAVGSNGGGTAGRDRAPDDPSRPAKRNRLPIPLRNWQAGKTARRTFLRVEVTPGRSKRLRPARPGRRLTANAAIRAALWDNSPRRRTFR